jgi:hypothetical protein
VLSETLFKISCDSDIPLTCCRKTLNEIDAIHWPSFGEASEGILFRAMTVPNPAKRISAKQAAGSRDSERPMEGFGKRLRGAVRVR